MSNNLKFKIFNNGINNKNISLLVGVTHNSNHSLNFINSIITSDLMKFDNFLLELNNDNLNFILKNKIIFSEFYPIINQNIHKIIKIDMSIEKELKSYNANELTSNLFTNLIQYKLDKFLYYKLRNILTKEKILFFNLQNLSFNFFNNLHIIKREEYMIDHISKNLDLNKNNLVIVGISHFEFIAEKLKILL